MTDLDKPVVRRTEYVVGGKRIVATLAANGLTLRKERSREKKTISWAKLYTIAYGIPGPLREGQP